MELNICPQMKRCKRRYPPQSRRGIIFTIICIVLLALLLTSVSTYHSYTRNAKAQLLLVTVDSMQRMLENLEQDMERATHIVTFRSILTMEGIVSGAFGGTTPEFLQDGEAVFSSLFMNGTYNGTAYFLMENNTFPNWTAKAINTADNLDFLLTFNVNGITLNQSDPWYVDAYVDIDMSIRDLKNIAEINKTVLVKTSVSIEEFEDPLYNKFTNNSIVYHIRKSPYMDNFSSADLNNLKTQLNSSYYVATTQGPSFLDRFEGRLGPSQYGIESLVDFQSFFNKSLAPPTQLAANIYKNSSVVDYLYWNSSQSYKNNSVNGMPIWFRMDNLTGPNSMDHTQYYNVSSLLLP